MVCCGAAGASPRLGGGETRARLTNGPWERSGRQPAERGRGAPGRSVLRAGQLRGWLCHPILWAQGVPVWCWRCVLGVSGRLRGVRTSISPCPTSEGTDPFCVLLGVPGRGLVDRERGLQGLGDGTSCLGEREWDGAGQAGLGGRWCMACSRPGTGGPSAPQPRGTCTHPLLLSPVLQALP